jgi:hypothetical protein
MTSNKAEVAERDTEVVERQDMEITEQTAEEAMIVAKPFNSEYRRHRVDDTITRADLEKSHLDFDHLVEQGFIVVAATTRDVPETAPKDVLEKEKELTR